MPKRRTDESTTNRKDERTNPRADEGTIARAVIRTGVTAQELREFGRRLRRWFRKHGRDLPWRRTRDPYRVLVSELMLQQTQVSRVVPKYRAFLRTYPTLESIAASTPARVSEAWDGLGYYARARNLHRLAVTVASAPPDGGNGTPAHRRRRRATLPPDPAELRALPGIGAYTAGAVASFAHERRAALVDTNVARVIRRVFAPHLPPTTSATTRILWSIAEASLPRGGPATWTHNQALIELGALVCTARIAHCGKCPVRTVCRTFAAENGRTRTAAARRAGRTRAAAARCPGRTRSVDPSTRE